MIIYISRADYVEKRSFGGPGGQCPADEADPQVIPCFLKITGSL